MDILKAKRDFQEGKDKFVKYLNRFSGPKDLERRINAIFYYLSENNRVVTSYMFEQAFPLITNKKNSSNVVNNAELIRDMIKVFLVLLDSMDYAGYIKVNIFPGEVKIEKNTEGVDIKFQTEVFKSMKEQIKKDKESTKKKNEKK
jgi:hypothetical protein